MSEQHHLIEDLYYYDEHFRDTIGTVDADGKRIWVYPRKPSGRYHRARIGVTVVLLSLLFAGPFIKIGGQPLLLLNVFERRFVLFGQIFWPQDFYLLALLGIIFFVFIILFTVVFGRIWCGWACPQTLFMEMVFRKIEYWIEGDANQQRKLNAAPWTTGKALKKGAKFLLFLLIAALIGHTAMAYLLGIEEVGRLVSSPPTDNIAGFLGLIAFTGLFFSVFMWFREQACIAVCPYGRLQGVLLDKQSIAVMYDWLRGEKRGKLKKGQEAPADQGDCIDCRLCVHACPTGIDIRNGTQLECVNCTACIDACDEVMEKLHKPKGLIRYSSHSAIAEGNKTLITRRVMAYSLVLLILLGVFAFALSSREEVEVTILKVPGQLYERQEDGSISNLYNITFVNKTDHAQELSLALTGLPGASITRVGAEKNILLPPGGQTEGIFFVTIPEAQLSGSRNTLHIHLCRGQEVIQQLEAGFLAPPKRSTQTPR